MFGEGFENRRHAIPGVPGLKLELAGDLRFRGPRGVRRLRRDRDGRPYVLARRESSREADDRPRGRRVMLHRAVMAVVLGRPLSRGEMVDLPP